MFEHKVSKDGIELKPVRGMRLRNECLNDEFSDDKTLKQILIEGLRKYDTKNQITDILEIKDCKKFFMKYFCLFYKK